MAQRHERLVEEIGTAERELLTGLEWRLKNRDRADLENYLRRLDRLAGSLPEGHFVRLVVENAAAHARTRGQGRLGGE